jgi:phosphoribosylformylglycinamidine synthase subunit PurQ / glutaminase
VDVVVERIRTVFTSAYAKCDRLRLPVAHGDGRFVAADDTLRMLEAEGRVVLRYVADTEGSPLQPNPNGSANHIAGICNAAGTVVGIMPHPERIAEGVLGPPDGLGFFRSLAAWQPRASTLNVPSR